MSAGFQNTHFPATAALPIASLQLYYMNTGDTLLQKDVRRRFSSFHSSSHSKPDFHDDDTDSPKELSRTKSIVHKIKRTFSRKSKKGSALEVPSRPASMEWHVPERPLFGATDTGGEAAPSSNPMTESTSLAAGVSLDPVITQIGGTNIEAIEAPITEGHPAIDSSLLLSGTDANQKEITAVSEQITEIAELSQIFEPKADSVASSLSSPPSLANEQLVGSMMPEVSTTINETAEDGSSLADSSEAVLEGSPGKPMFLPFRISEEELSSRPLSVETDVPSSESPPLSSITVPPVPHNFEPMKPSTVNPLTETSLDVPEEEDDVLSVASSSIEREFFSAVERAEKNDFPPIIYGENFSESASEVISIFGRPKSFVPICKPFVVAVASLGVFAMAVPVVSHLFRR